MGRIFSWYIEMAYQNLILRVRDAIVLDSVTYPHSARLNGQGMVASSNSVARSLIFMQRLPKGFYVGPTLATYNSYRPGYPPQWGFHPPIHVALARDTVSQYGPLVLRRGDNYVGFRFSNGIDQQKLYRWAVINIDVTPGSGGVTIKEWAYSDIADTPIYTADVPEPSTPALTLLGLGAAGLRAWRARKKAQAEALAA